MGVILKEQSWVVVANSSNARILKIISPTVLEEIITLEHPESRLYNRDLSSDKPGRDFESTRSGTRHSLEPQHTPKEVEFIVFAKEIAHFLTDAKNRNAFSHLYLVASPSMLGLLRKEFNDSVSKSLVKEVSKDLTHSSDEEILKQFD